VTPLVFASGAGSASRHSLGTAVFGGMILSTILNLFVTPVLYVFIAGLEERLGMGRGKQGPPDDSLDASGPGSLADPRPVRI
jgi:HAE1 family hydrophobic/amphiphilic exporter-1